MLFDSALFLWFFGVVFVVYWTIARWHAARIAWLLLASYAFYASWNVELLLLIVGSTLIDFFVGQRVYEAEEKQAKKRWLMVSLFSNLGLLALFKYGDFVLTNVQDVVDAFGGDAKVPLLNLVLPVGISFYTFQTLSYTIDIYYGRMKPTRNLAHFALFVSFFPQLVAGPIVRARDLLPQLSERPVADPVGHGRGFFLIARGLVKKVAIADYLALNIVDRVYDNPELYSSAEMLFAIYAYSVQIYCDFSGYSDVAIGAALLLGLKLPDNFARPFAAADLQDHWRRWHITLSSWLRDYLYIPLGGSRKGTYKTYRNLFITMLLGGLWHGAAWTFIVWGALHGSALAVVRAVQRRWPRERRSRLHHVLAVLVTFHFVCFSWVFFRASSLQNSQDILAVLAEGSTYIPNVTPTLAAVVFGVLALHMTPKTWVDDVGERFAGSPALVQAALLAAVAVALAQLKSTAAVPFIYFQF